MQYVPAALKYGPEAYRAVKYVGQAIRTRLGKEAYKKAGKYVNYASNAYSTLSALGQLTPKKRRNSYPQTAPVKKVVRQLSPGNGVFAINRRAKRALKYKGAKYGKLTGMYGGAFALAKRQNRLLNAKFIRNGLTRTVETHGLIDDPNCCYIMHSSMAYKPIITTLARSLARKLWVKAGFFPTSSTETIPLLGVSADSYVMKIYDQTRTEIGSYAATGTGDCTVDYFGATIATVLLNYTNQPASPNDKVVPVWIVLYQDPNDTVSANDNYIQLSKICLYDEVMHLKVSSDLKIQNRSNSAGGSSNVEDVSNNPLVGRAYTFNYLPRPYNTALDTFNSINSDYGVKLLRAAEFTISTGGNYMQEPPMPKTFRNCKASSVIRLEPGQIKNYRLEDVVKKNVLKWLESIAFNNLTLVTRVNCKVNLIALEDVINVNEDQLITLAYENQKSICVYTETKTKVPMLSDFIMNEVDNITA